MANNTGEHILDALLSLGYDIEMTEEGTITVTNGTQPLHARQSTAPSSGLIGR